jgi:drug/metabolite transporter (DMT)-like permease
MERAAQRRVWPAYVQLASSMILVGTSVIFGKYIVDHVPVALTAALRFMISLVVLLPMTLASGRLVPQLERREWGSLFLQAFCGVFLFNFLILEGVRRTSMISVGVITSALPAAIAIGGWLLLRERLRLRLWVSVGLAILGIAAVNASTSTRETEASAIGNLLVVGAVLAEALFSVLAKRLSGRLTPTQMSFWVNLIGLVLFLPLAVPLALSFSWSVVPDAIWLVLMVYAVSSGVFSFVLWYAGQARVPVSVAGLFTGFAPLTTAALAIIVLGERPTIGVALGAAALFGSLAVATWPERPHQ